MTGTVCSVRKLAQALFVFVMVCGVWTASTGQSGATPGDFEMYVLELTWTANFCCGHTTKQQCIRLNSEDYSSSHLTLHGLWPQYSTKRGSFGWPQFCGEMSVCESNANSLECLLSTGVVSPFVDFWKQYAPGYAYDSLYDHEWPKHGSCTRRTASQYFEDALRLTIDLDEGKLLTESAGSLVDTEKVRKAYGGLEGKALVLKCSKGSLQSVSTCWNKRSEDDDAVGSQVDCPEWMIREEDSCATSQVYVEAFGSCRVPPPPPPPPPGSSRGPYCVGQETSFCTNLGYLRCAKSGYCTNVPLR
eukprot:TRINITY_DN5378_c0_g1_i1.p1 TRINITY_DN5378_c0_g1~~TRINITY_DN5378_c0_g1_i1.p1  ORF type:complete len:314 (-),score=78.98 TRINITY_DN5378_c0_g1_i1:30-938(-)